jgi:hypothetical protein
MDFHEVYELISAVGKLADGLDRIEKRLAGIEAGLKKFGSSYDAANEITKFDE